MNTIQNKAEFIAPVSMQELEIGNQMDIKARAFGVSQSRALGDIVSAIVKAKQEYEGGSFVVLFKLTESLSDAQRDELPEPNLDHGNNPSLYKKREIGAKGKPVTKSYNFYNVMSDSLACNVAKTERIGHLELSLGDPSKVNMQSVPQDIKDLAPDYVHAEISRLKGEMKTSRDAINKAFELMFQIKAIKDLDGVDCYPIMKLNKDGTESKTEVENTKTPLVVQTTLDNRKSIDVKRLGIGAFMLLKPAVAKEHGGTYKALMDTVARGTKSEDEPGGDKPVIINTNESLCARLLDCHEYAVQVTDDPKQTAMAGLVKLINGPGSDDMLITFTELQHFLSAVLDKTHNASKRYQALIVSKAEAAA